VSDQTAEIAGRLFLVDELDVVDIETWCYRLVPMDLALRPVEEWAEEHIREIAGETLRELLGVPSAGNFQVLFRATLRGFWVRPYDEYDESIEFREVEYEAIPENYLKMLQESSPAAEETS